MSVYSKKNISVFGLVMINLVAIDSLRTLPLGAEYGFSLVFYYLAGAIAFFIPTALVAAELATGWPQTGGIYIWVREAFGKKTGFMTIWIQWFYNTCWYPTIMSFIAATIAYCINPGLIDNKLYMLSVIIPLFWICSFINFLGMKASSIMSAISALIGTIFPMLFIICLGGVWLWQGKPIQINFSVHDFYPDLSNMSNLVLLTGILYGYVGIEMSAAHAGDVQDPQKDYPKAVLLSCAMIFFTLMLASLAIALVVPQYKLNVISGLLQAFDSFFTSFHMHWLTPILAMLMICGSLGGVNAWILGPGKGLLAATKDGCLPEILTKTNSKGVPVAILLMQGIIFTILCSAFLLLPTVSSGFWVLSAVTSILALIVYIAMFAAAIRLRYKFPNVKRAFIIPGGLIGLWSVCLIGLVSCLFTIGIGFLPPSQIPVGNLKRYELILSIGVVLGCLIPFIFYSVNSSMKKRKFLLNEALISVAGQ